MPPPPKRSRDADITYEYEGEPEDTFAAAIPDIQDAKAQKFTLTTVSYDPNNGPLLRLVFKGEKVKL